MYRIKRLLKQVKGWVLMSWYLFFFYSSQLKEKWILIDSKNGKDLGSNMLRILEELACNPEYQKYRLFLSCHKDKREDILKMLETYQIRHVKILRENGFRYARIIGMAKYLFTDTSFPIWYNKKEGQIITNTWHGTPLKMMGRHVSNRAYDMGNVQRSHLLADYLIYPSDFMKEAMSSAYMLDNMYAGKILCSGYPRNSVFFEKNKAKALREKMGLGKNRLYAYMPTWRGVLKHLDPQKNKDQMEYYFVQLDKQLKDDEIFFVRLHPFIGNDLDFSSYQHIKPFPEGYDPYDILNICDSLVTDYSSVFFDYANSRNKIILFAYDKEAYMDERGVYVSMDTFPFPIVRRIEELLREMRAPKQYDDRAFVEKYCKYDGKNVASKICRHVILGEKQYQEHAAETNGKENVLLYAGNLSKNGLTTALLNLLENIDKEKRNYIVTFRSNALEQDPERVSLIPKEAFIFPITSVKNKSLGEVVALSLYYDKKNKNKWILKKVDRFYKRLYKCCFGMVHFDYVIQYTGYEKDIINMFLQADCQKVIYVHNDMVGEMKTRNNQHEYSLRRAYREYDKVVTVTADIIKPTIELGALENKTQVANNCHDYKSVIEKSKCELCFDSDTECNVSYNKLNEILSSNAKKFITIGRFSPEKGHNLLLKAFEKYYLENPNTYLIIIGGHGALYQETVDKANASKAADHIIIIKSISNPMPVLKKCDLFILSSLYEGLGLVILEADTLGIPVVSTDIVGPRGFMQKYGGYMVPLGVDGLYNGMNAFREGMIPIMNVDYELYNQSAVQQFEQIFEEKHG